MPITSPGNDDDTGENHQPTLRKNTAEPVEQTLKQNTLDLRQYLARGRKRRTRKKGRKAKGPRIPMRVPIADRPEAVGSRKGFGHFESDTVVGAAPSRRCMNTQVERRSRRLFARLQRLAVTVALPREQIGHAIVSLTLLRGKQKRDACHSHCSGAWTRARCARKMGGGINRRYQPI